VVGGVRRDRGPGRVFFDLWSVVYDNRVVQRAVYRVEHDAVMAVLPAMPCGSSPGC
jgi:hypothetical protein